MKKCFFVLILSFFMCFHTQANVTLSCDPTESSIKFKTKLLSLFDVSGSFDAMSVDIDLRDTNIINSVKVRIDTNSINTNNKTRDRDLKGKKFLNAIENPYITFEVNKELTVQDRSIVGELKINGIKKEIDFPVYMQYLKNEGTNQYVLSVKSKKIIINRHDFNISDYPVFISDEIDVEIDLVLKVYINPA